MTENPGAIPPMDPDPLDFDTEDENPGPPEEADDVAQDDEADDDGE